MTPKQWIRYVKRLEKHNLAICDGVSSNAVLPSLFDILYPLFIMSGLSVFLGGIIYWDRIKNIFRR